MSVIYAGKIDEEINSPPLPSYSCDCAYDGIFDVENIDVLTRVYFYHQ